MSQGSESREQAPEGRPRLARLVETGEPDHAGWRDVIGTVPTIKGDWPIPQPACGKGGLVVHPMLGEEWSGWVITHRRTGKRLPGVLGLPSRAINLVEALLTLTDWDVPCIPVVLSSGTPMGVAYSRLAALAGAVMSRTDLPTAAGDRAPTDGAVS